MTDNNGVMVKKADSNVPELRFKEFARAWERYKFKDKYRYIVTNSFSRN